MKYYVGEAKKDHAKDIANLRMALEDLEREAKDEERHLHKGQKDYAEKKQQIQS